MINNISNINDNGNNGDKNTYTYNKKLWMKFLRRKLSYDEKKLLKNVKFQRRWNKKLCKFYDVCDKNNLHIPILTNLDGNCFFECMVYNGLYTSVDELRQKLSELMLINKHNKFSFLDCTMEESFKLFNEIDYVLFDEDGNITSEDSDENGDDNGDNKRKCEYTYDVMCDDLATDCSWSKLPTELIIRFMSFMFKLKFEIYHSNGHVTLINTFDNDNNNDNIKTIRLGLIGESHYIPVKLNNTNNTNKLYYNDYELELCEWAEKCQKEVIEEYNKRLNKLKKYRSILPND